MKVRRPIFWFFAIIIVLIALMFWQGKKKPATTPESNIVPQMVTTSNPPVSVPIHTNTASANVSTNAIAPIQTPVGTMRQGLAAFNDIPIVFYGRIVDQFGDVVPYAKVNFNVRVYNGVRSGVDRGQVISDGNGSFTISGYKGESLGIAVKKTGYVFVSMNGSAIYSAMWPESQRAHPDPNNPVVIKMWKLQGAEPLLGINQNYRIHYTNGPINFDLVAGKIVPSGGDLEITVNRPEGVISQQHPQNWNIELQFINGGFIETSASESMVTYSAPENGYQPQAAFGNNNGPDAVDEMLFIQSRNGQVYSKIHLLFGINRTPDGFMDISFNGVANTNGSRNWEATAPQ